MATETTTPTRGRGRPALHDILDRLARRAGAFRWVACWEDEGGWSCRAPHPTGRDEIYVLLAPTLSTAVGPTLVEAVDLGDLGARLGAAGVTRLLVLGSGEGLGCLVALENPDPARLDGLSLGEAGGLSDLGPLAGQVFRAERHADELLTFLDWVPHLEEVGFGEAEEATALEVLGRIGGHRAVVALAPLPRGVSVATAWLAEPDWRRDEATVTGWDWERAWDDPGAAVRDAAARMGIPETGGWATGRSRAFDPSVILGVAGGPVPPSRPGMEAFATAMARTLADRRVGDTTRQTTLLQERSRLASIIHEGITQVLTNVAIQLEILDHVLDDPEKAREMTRSARTAVLEALDSLRGAVFEMAPAAGEWGDLATGLARYTADFGSQWGLEVDCSVEGEARQVPSDALALAFAFVQEGLTNLRRHAGTSRGEVTLRFEEDWLSLSVCDRGVGFDLRAREEQGFRQHQGLALMRARASLVGGRFEVRSAPGDGTCISLRIPG